MTMWSVEEGVLVKWDQRLTFWNMFKMFDHTERSDVSVQHGGGSIMLCGCFSSAERNQIWLSDGWRFNNDILEIICVCACILGSITVW